MTADNVKKSQQEAIYIFVYHFADHARCALAVITVVMGRLPASRESQGATIANVTTAPV